MQIVFWMVETSLTRFFCERFSPMAKESGTSLRMSCLYYETEWIPFSLISASAYSFHSVQTSRINYICCGTEHIGSEVLSDSLQKAIGFLIARFHVQSNCLDGIGAKRSAFGFSFHIFGKMSNRLLFSLFTDYLM